MFPVSSLAGHPARLGAQASRNQSSSRSVETLTQSTATGGAAIVIDNQLVAADGTIPETIRRLPAKEPNNEILPASSTRPTRTYAPVLPSPSNAIPVQLQPTANPVRGSHSFSLPRIGSERLNVAPTLIPSHQNLTLREVRLPEFAVSIPNKVIENTVPRISTEQPSSAKLSNEKKTLPPASDLQLSRQDSEEKVNSLLRQLSANSGSRLIARETPTGSFFIDA